MTQPEVPLTPEHQAVADQLYERILEMWVRDGKPDEGWTIDDLSSEVRQALLSIEGLASAEHTHTTSDIEGLWDEVESRLLNYAKNNHTHDATDLEGVSENPDPNTVVLRGGSGEIRSRTPSAGGEVTNKSYVDTELAKKADNVHTHPIGRVIGLQGVLDLKAPKTHTHKYEDITGLDVVIDDAVREVDLVASRQRYTFTAVDRVLTSHVVTLYGIQGPLQGLVSIGERILLAGQQNSVENGVWVVSRTAWFRDTGMPSGSVVPTGALVPVRKTSKTTELWRMRRPDPSEVGKNSLLWELMLTAGDTGINFTPGPGLKLTSGVLNLELGDQMAITPEGLSVDMSGIMRKYAADIPAGSSVVTLKHNLGTKDVYVAVYEIGTGDQVLLGITINDTNNVTAEFHTPPRAGQYRAVIFG